MNDSLKMVSRFQDLWLWTSIGVFGFFAARKALAQLHAMRAISKVIEDFNKQPDNFEKSVQDALKLKTLWMLTKSPNESIRSAAVNIITDRSAQGATYDLILEDIAGQDPYRRDKALVCLKFLFVNGGRLPDSLYYTYKALVGCLLNLHPEVVEFETTYRFTAETTRHQKWQDRERRSQHCRDALEMLAGLIDYPNQDAVRAVIIPWLAHYPFGGQSSFEAKKKIFKEITAGCYGDSAMFKIALWAMDDAESREQLIQHDLVDRVKQESGEDGDEVIVPSPLRPRDSRDSEIMPELRGGQRVREESFEEQALRRRRREAMVLGEHGRPIERSDIIERQDSAQIGAWDQEMEVLPNETQDEETAIPGGHGGWRTWVFSFVGS